MSANLRKAKKLFSSRFIFPKLISNNNKSINKILINNPSFQIVNKKRYFQTSIFLHSEISTSTNPEELTSDPIDNDVMDSAMESLSNLATTGNTTTSSANVDNNPSPNTSTSGASCSITAPNSDDRSNTSTAAAADGTFIEEKDSIEVKDPNLIFQLIVKNLEDKFGRNRLYFPKEIYFLVGAPGSGKGTMLKYINAQRGLTARPITVSELLNSAEMQEIKNSGKLISDRQVIEAVFTKLLDPMNENGVVVDGFPRTVVQAQCISLLYDLMLQLRQEFQNDPIVSQKFRRPSFRLCVLFVDEKVSIERQLSRGKKIIEQNKIVKETGLGQMQEVRQTDIDESAAKLRYKYFRDSIYESVKFLKDKIPFNFIDASGTIEDTAENIAKELAYQSSLELGKTTFDLISSIPTSEEICTHARQLLVRRLDGYSQRNSELFRKVIQVIKTEFLHIIQRQALSGVAIIRSENPIFKENPLALTMVLDVLTERGFQVILDYERKLVPTRIDPFDHTIIHEPVRVFHFEIQFEKPRIRN
ncbi:hypothetical protein ABK040_014984 [Willaertia magna]